MTVDVKAAPNPDQAAAIGAGGTVFVSAGAGTGKTTVIVERFLRALDQGVDVVSILVITFTERAAGELRTRIRARLVEAGRPVEARELDGGWISTIHGFCHRLLRLYATDAGLDPRFRVLDESQASVLRAEAFGAALGDFCADGHPERVRLLATYGAEGLRRMLTGVAETLRSAGRGLDFELGEMPDLDGRLEELRRAADLVLAQTSGDGSVEAARSQVTHALALVASSPGADLLLDLSAFSVRGRGADRFTAYEEARLALEQTALNVAAVHDRELLEELLRGFDRAYQEAKDRESGLDFEDLQLRARDLLRDNPAVREREGLRFRSVMVDEFQDTNRLQCELIDLVAGGGGGVGEGGRRSPEALADQRAVEELFFVGDEFQSIYRFRHADVEVFRERRADADDVLPLTWNYRSRPELLSVVNELFAEEFGEGYRPLRAGGRVPDVSAGPVVELLVSDKQSYRDADIGWRRGEARAAARRVALLVETGEATPGDVVFLFAAGTDAELFEEELRALGLPTYRAAGRGYFGQQQVIDLLAYLRLLHNRYDDEALVTVLASPFVGVSPDALVLLRRAAGRRPLYCGVERRMPEGLSDGDEQLFRAFRQRYDRLLTVSRGVGLERLLDQIVSEHDYDLAVLAQWDGRRRYANMRKLARLARSFEDLRGRDVEGFMRFVADQQAAGAHEAEAFAEEEGADAVRLLTIHAAKGLEFKVVVVADAGRDRPPARGEEIICLPDGRFGFKVLDPLTGKRRGAFEYEEVRRIEEAAAEAERLRLYYVAMTRAIDRLVISGSIDPERAADARTPIGWVLGRLGQTDLGRVGTEPVVVEQGPARLLLRVDRWQAATAAAEEVAEASEGDGQLALFAAADGPEPAVVPALPALVPPPSPPVFAPQRLSYSALQTFAECGFKFYARYVAGMRERDGAAELGAVGIGSAVHAVLETLDLAAPAVPDHVRALVPEASPEELARIEAFVTAYCDSTLARRISGLEGARAERHFAFDHQGVVLHGFIDVLRLGREALVVDFKTNALEERSPQEVADEEYRLQRLVYALACFRSGAEAVEVVYQFLERPEELAVSNYGTDDVPTLEAELTAEIDALREARFEPRPSQRACAECPALDVVCAGPGLRGAGGA